MTEAKIGFIGQGWIGKNYSDDFEKRGIPVVRFSLEEPFVQNKDKIKECDIVFIAVPTPTTPQGFDLSIVLDVLKLVGHGSTVVIKSTLLPGSTKKLALQYPNLYIMHNPEFLSVATAEYDAEHPTRNIIGIPQKSEEYEKHANDVLAILPKAPFELICDSTEAELIKYARNCIGYVRVLMANIFFDTAGALGADFDVIKNAISADPDNGPLYANALHKSGRGAGGECFIKDFRAFSDFYGTHVDDALGLHMLKSLEQKNIDLLTKTHKDIPLLRGVYGDMILP